VKDPEYFSGKKERHDPISTNKPMTIPRRQAAGLRIKVQGWHQAETQHPI
jgi:hypothetical protein